MAPQLFPTGALERLTTAASESERSVEALLARFKSVVRGYPEKPGFKAAVEPFAVTAALSALVLLGYLWVRIVEPLVIPPSAVVPVRTALAVATYAGFYVSLSFWLDVLERKPIAGRRILLLLPLLILGTPAALLGALAMASVTTLAILLPAAAILPVLYLLRGQLAIAKWGARQKPDRLVAWVGFILIAAAAIIAAWGIGS